MSRTLVGTRIRERRRAKKISQVGLAKQVGISASYLNLIEHNRRGIAGKTLLTIAKALEINPRYLSEGADQGLIDRIKKAAAKTSGAETELGRTEEFIGRFPGFAALIERLFDQVEVKDQTMQALSDKMSNDPFFAEAMHLMLSSITVIRSTTDILSSSSDIQEERQQRFLSNLMTESERLSKTAEEVLQHFEPSGEALEGESDERSVETFLESKNYFLDELEGPIYPLDAASRIEELVDGMAISNVDRQRSVRILSAYAECAERLPVEAFLGQAERFGFNPLLLADHYQMPLHLIFWRLAHLPPHEDFSQFGLLECDGSAAVLYRKALNNFSLPRYSSACPLWPIYGAMSQPMHPISALIVMPSGEQFMAYAVSRFHTPGRPGVPGQLRSTMLFSGVNIPMADRLSRDMLPEITVGFQCSVCPRTACLSRRNGYLLG
ncbi:MAG: XRE family transcriptional regulator [Rhodomicrobium sp.]|nr:MAG: XRE family transcriptional regulator [Rhodomicrobium sp.]